MTIDPKTQEIHAKVEVEITESDTVFVLHSGGIDSTTCLAIAIEEFGHNSVRSISVDYGQRHRNEIDAAKGIAELYGIPHQILSLGNLIPKTMLTDPSQEVPDVTYDEITGVSPTYVPFRNGFMLSAIAALAQGHIDQQAQVSKGVPLQFHNHFGHIYFGAHAEDAANWAYPDCTPEFIGSMANAIYVGTYHRVRLHTPIMWMQKASIIKLGIELDAPLHLTWSCYKGGEKHCGSCPTCYSRKQGFEKAGISDPTPYL